MYEQNRNRGRSWLPVLTGVLVGLSMAALAMTLFMVFKAPTYIEKQVQGTLAEELRAIEMPTLVTPADPTSTGVINSDRRNAIVMASEKVAPAVVAIQMTQMERYSARPRSLQEWFEMWGRPQVYEREVPGGQGSGVLVSPFGRVVTNSHVVNGAKRILVTLSDGRQFPAHVLDASTKHDIALLELEIPEGERLPYAELGDSESLMIGEWAIAIGSPFAFQLNDIRPSVTVGVISALSREVRPSADALYTDMIQTDAAINPGNSGGPLVNSAGQVIGINTLIFTKDGGSLGIGFARPIDKVVWILNEFERYGKVRDTWAGFEGGEVRPYHVVHLGLEARQGIFVTRVYNGGPADDAGLAPGDVVVAIDGHLVRSLNEGNLMFSRYEVGDEVELTVDRKGEQILIPVGLESYDDYKDN
ncbi:MAG: trypsin-like serine protease [bacterium]|nr:trypsin-like serine protease [bacterium]